jgi:hypothetical protein
VLTGYLLLTVLDAQSQFIAMRSTAGQELVALGKLQRFSIPIPPNR